MKITYVNLHKKMKKWNLFALKKKKTKLCKMLESSEKNDIYTFYNAIKT